MADYQQEKKSGEQGSDDDKEILAQAREYLKHCIEDEDTERMKMQDDLRFCTLDQWPSDIRSDRENREQDGGPRPCLTIDKINQYIVQVVNDVRQGKPGINVRPQDDAADVETAKVLKGLVRNIEDQSNADIAYTTAIESAARIGLGYFRILAEYVDDKSFDQELFIRPIQNTFSTYLGRHTMPDGSDAEYAFIVDKKPLEKFKSEFPNAKWEAKDFDGIDSTVMSYWRTEDSITVVEFFCMKRTTKELYFLADGVTLTKEQYEAIDGEKPEVVEKRQTISKQLKWRKMTALEVLEKRDLPGKYIPIVEVVGRESFVDGRRILWGLVRPAKDSLRMYNYWASTITERMGLAPKQPYIAAEGQIEGREAEWKTANKLNRSVLTYKPIDINGNALPAPKREGPIPMEAALLQQMQVIEHDVQTSLGMFKAAVGETESQQSGRAILALQRESDTGTYHFGANLGVSIRHAGRIIVDLIPHYYDTKRIVRILGEDGEVDTVTLDPDQQQSHVEIQQPGGIKHIYNPGVGKYDVSITVGPSYNTKRMEAQAMFVEMAKGATDPASAALLRYLVMRNSDSAGADEAAKALKALLPPPVAEAIGKDPVPALMARVQQMGAQMQQMGEQSQKLQQENMQLKAGVAEATVKAEAEKQIQAARLQSEAQLEASRQAFEQQQAAWEHRLQVAEAQREADFRRFEALLEARTDIAVAKIKAENQPEPARAQ